MYSKWYPLTENKDFAAGYFRIIFVVDNERYGGCHLVLLLNKETFFALCLDVLL